MSRVERGADRPAERDSTAARVTPSTAAPGPNADALLALQRSGGNQVVTALLASQAGRPAVPGAGAAARAASAHARRPPGGPTQASGPAQQSSPSQAVVQRDGPPASAAPAAAPTLDQASQRALAAAGVVLADDENQALAQAFPQGIVVGQGQPMILGMRFGQRLDGYRLTGFRVTSAAPAVGQGVEAWIFQVGKGRSILVSSIGGGSVLMDAGTGQTTSVNAPSVRRLVGAVGAVTAGPAQVPERIIGSHADTDHYNAVRALMAEAAFSNTAIQVAMEQLRGAGAGAWSSMSLTVQPTQRVIEVNVTAGGGSVHVNRLVIDNMELTEFRSVAAHQDLTRSGTARYNRNRTSPVVVVRDLVSGQRMLFTSDAQGRQFDEIVNAIGDTGMRRILGAEGHNLKLMEAPHHFGEQSGPDARGMLNMLQLAYESGEGSLRLVAQTTQAFATRGSSTYTFLDASGAAPERIEGDPSPPGQAQATRARGSQLDKVTLDLAGIQRAIEVLQANDTTLRQAYQRLAELDGMRGDTAAMAEALNASGAPAPLRSSVAATDAELVRLQTELRTNANQVWDQMRAAAAAEGGMRGSADLTQVNTALTQLTARVTAQQADLTRARNDLEAHRAGLTLYARLSANAVKMIAALQADNIEELYRTRAEHTDLVQAARAALGPADVHEHVRVAWQAVRAEWTPERFEARTAELSALVAQREMSAEFRALLAETLSRQMQLNKIVAEAENSGRTVYGPGGTIVTPASTRIGAGVLAAIEVVRIGLECAAQYKAGADAMDARNAAAARQGVATMHWWLRLGLTPVIALAQRGSWSGKFTIVYDSDQALARQAATGDTRPAGVPDFDMVVVTALDGGELRRLVHRAVAELATLEDWHAFNGGCPAGPAFKHYGDGWGVRLWSRDSQQYVYVRVDDLDPGINAELDRLHVELEKAQQGKMAADVKAAGADAVKSVKDTAWVFGSDRRVVVYDEGGHAKRIDFDSATPRFLRQGRVSYPVGVEGPLELVKAADMATYKRLAGEWWVETTGEKYMDATGTHESMRIEQNGKGYAYVEPDELIRAGS